MTEFDFEGFPSISRLSREMVVTEKIDGSNAQIGIFHTTLLRDQPNIPEYVLVDGYAIMAGSRTTWLSEKQDNFGFFRWVKENAEQLALLGPGRHFGEWWGQGIQRKYGLSEKRFSLFNTKRWTSEFNNQDLARYAEDRNFSTQCIEIPCCHVTPVLARCTFSTDAVDDVLHALAMRGSSAAPGFMKPEGVVVYHVASNTMFKKTLDKNDGHKGA